MALLMSRQRQYQFRELSADGNRVKSSSHPAASSASGAAPKRNCPSATSALDSRSAMTSAVRLIRSLSPIWNAMFTSSAGRVIVCMAPKYSA
jgi:hypothetical protein